MPHAQGPFNIPLPDHLAYRLEAIVKSLPRDPIYTLKRTSLATKVSLNQSLDASNTQRSDVSWISEESIDRSGDIVLANGMDDSLFGANPVVTPWFKQGY